MAEESPVRPADRVVPARPRGALGWGTPWETCSCSDHCDGDYGGPHCNADLGAYIDTVIAATRANASTATYLDLHCHGVARDLDGDPDRHCCGDSDDCADTDCGGAVSRHRASHGI